jgi:hypothetical protein
MTHIAPIIAVVSITFNVTRGDKAITKGIFFKGIVLEEALNLSSEY